LLETEIREQGRVLAARTEPGWAAALEACELLRPAEHVVLAARGTSDNAARYAQYLFGSELRLLAGLAAPWLYASAAQPKLAHAAVIAISQSGRSPDVVAVMAAARAQGQPAIAITNDPSSPLAEVADVVVPLLAGEERSVAATKTYLCSLHAIAQICAGLSGDHTGSGWFERLPDLVSATVEEQLAGRARFDRLAEAGLITVVGRGLQFATACETALKIRELSGIPAEAFSPPDLLHGPIAALSGSGALWAVGEVDAIEFAGLRVAVAGPSEAADIAVPLVSDLPPWVAPLVAVVPGQTAALRLGELRGVDLDHPHGLRKVTITR
jgi:glucosamine--fructose-6-phosphate aminotransferase (isomerizing)